MARSALSAALVVALGLALAGLLLRALGPDDGAARSPMELLRLLFAAAGLCVAGLLRHRAPGGAWLAAVIAAWLAALEVVGSVRRWSAESPPETWPWLVVVGEVALVASAALAGAYAARHTPIQGRPHRGVVAWRLVSWTALAAIVGFAAWVVAMAFVDPVAVLLENPATTDTPPLRGSGLVAVGFVAVMTLAGASRDLAGPARRARSRAGSLRELPRAFADEVLPNQAATRRRAEEGERARLAAELHARVLPDLRRAADAAEAAGSGSDPVALGLRHAVQDVEQLMLARQSVVLEEYGLLAALEWLAERTQQRAALQVDVELDGGAVDDPAAVPKPVARAAFRVALLALDNVVRHAGASRVVLQLEVVRGRVSLGIADDGRGIDVAASRRGGRGLADMRAAAAEVGAAIRIDRLAIGTRVELTWPGAEDHPVEWRDIAAGRGASAG